jgi:signal peptidase I
MNDATSGKTNTRKPLIALVLSLIQPGLGHIYCGRIVKGLILAFITSIFIPVIFVALMSQSPVRTIVIGASLCVFLVIYLIAIIDSWYVAMHTRPDYELKEYNRWYVYVIFVLMSTTGSTQIAMNVRSNLLEAFRVPATSMFPTIEFNDRFLTNKITYKNADPQRGDVIVFISPENRRQNLVKRVVAVAGDTVEIKDNQLYVNGEKLERKSVGRTSYCDSNGKAEGELFTEKNGQTEYKIFIADINSNEPRQSADFTETIVPKNHCFVLGDNRNYSHDSRHYGLVPLATIKGKAEYLYCPARDWSRFGSIK